MSAMEELAKSILPKILGPQMPQILEKLSETVQKVEQFEAQLNRIEAIAAQNNTLLTLIASGGNSIADRIEQGLGIIQETPQPSPETMLAQITEQGQLNNDGSYDFRNSLGSEFGNGAS